MSGYLVRPAGSRLTVNIDNSKHYIVEKSELAGIEDLRRLSIDGSQKEECWVYIEAEDRAGKGRHYWFEVGEAETAHSAQSDYKHFGNILEILKKNGLTLKAWRDYHYHPCGSQDWIKRAVSEKQSAKLQSCDYVSPQDYISFYISGVTLSKQGLHIRNLSYRIVTPTGLWSIDWKHADLSVDDLVSEQQLNELLEHVKYAYATMLAGIGLCVEQGKECDAEFYDYYQKFLTTDFVLTRYSSFPLDKLPDVPKRSDGITFPMHLGATYFVTKPDENTQESLGASFGLGVGYIWRKEPSGFVGGMGFSFDYGFAEMTRPNEAIDTGDSENFHVIDAGAWGHLGGNLGPVDLFVRPALGLRYTIFPGSESTDFWAGGSAGLGILGNGLSLQAPMRFQPSGAWSAGGALVWDIPSIVRNAQD